MKKVALLLVIIFIFSAFAGCVSKKSEGSSVESGNGSNEGSEMSEIVNEITSVLTGITVPENPQKTVISTNASYKKSVEAARQYADTYGTELTDGITGVAKDNFSDESLSGYEVKEIEVTLDLGAASDKIYGFEVGTYTTTGGGIGIPYYYGVSVSLDGKEWVSLGQMKVPELVEGTVQYATLTTKEYIGARYIKFNIKGSYPWMFFDEIMVIADVDGADSEANRLFSEAVNNKYAQLGSITTPNSGKAIDRNLDKVIISKGAKYSIKGKINPNFPDDAETGKLTDGKKKGYYESGSWVGFNQSEVTVKLDLGKEFDNIAEIEAAVFTNKSIKLFMPTAVKIVAIDGKGNSTDLGILYGNTVLEKGDYSFILPLSGAVTARYIEFTLYSVENTTILVEELAVYAYSESKEEGLYPALKFTPDGSDWGDNASEEYVNLIYGRTQQLYSSVNPGNEFRDTHYNGTPNLRLMTDGQYSDDYSIHNGKFFKFYMGSDRKVIYDLGHISAVDKFSASFCYVEGWAVIAPTTISVLVSADGEKWFDVGNIYLDGEEWLAENGTDVDEEGEIAAMYKGELVLDRKITARYVAFDFVVRTWAGCDELEVFGTKSIKNASSAESQGFKERNLYGTRIAPRDDLLGGAKDLCLLYHTEADPSYTYEDLLPYVAYGTEDDRLSDVMFDSFLFLCNGNFPKGHATSGSYLSDWEWSINNLFTEGTNLYALEEAAKTAVTEIEGLPKDYKYKVVLTLYNPVSEISDFGDVDGDGRSENFENYEDRIKSVKWLVDQWENAFEKADFQYIELVGYYWFDEDIEGGDSEILMLHNEISDYVHGKGKDFIWIPWFCAPGYQLWEDHGFDVACMQPNYVFDVEKPFENIENCAKYAENFGMGIEIEIFEESLRNRLFFEKYMAYLAGGCEHGYMNDTISMYYQSFFVYRDAAKAEDIMGRQIYDATYHYIKGDLEYSPKALTGLSFNAGIDELFEGKIEFSEERLRDFKLSSAPDHGSITINSDGSFVYYPEAGYSGEVKFSFVYTEFLGWSENCDVVITVG